MRKLYKPLSNRWVKAAIAAVVVLLLIHLFMYIFVKLFGSVGHLLHYCF